MIFFLQTLINSHFFYVTNISLQRNLVSPSQHIWVTYSNKVMRSLHFFSSGAGAANEDTASQCYAGGWVSNVLIKASANRGAINQRPGHSYSCPADHDCDVVFIQVLAHCLGQRPLLSSQLSNGGARRTRGEGRKLNPCTVTLPI